MFVLLGSAAIAAAAPLTVSVNDRPLPVAALVERGRALVPMRSIFAALGAGVVYDSASHRVTAHRGSDSVVVVLGSTTAHLNGFPIALDVAPHIAGDRVYVPLRFVAQALGARVSYDGAARTIFVRDAQPAVASLDTPAPSFPTSRPVPYVVQSQTYPGYQGFGFNLYIPSAGSERVFYPGDRVRFVLTAPPGGTAFLRICGFGDLPFINPPGSTQYFTNFVVPNRLRDRNCSAIAYYTGALGAQQEIGLAQSLYFAAPVPSPTPRPTERPTPAPTATPSKVRHLEPVFRATSPP